MQLQPVKANLIYPNRVNRTLELSQQQDIIEVEPVLSRREVKRLPFIEANTKEVTIEHLKNDCIVPVFSKDNEITISHPHFIESVWEAANRVFPSEQVETPEIRVSHIIKGRTPEAIHKPVRDLLEEDKTIYYERMMFCFEIPTIYEDIMGNRLNLTIGGVRAYNHENLYSKKGAEKFKIFIGWRVRVCSNLMLTNDGLTGRLEVMSDADIYSSALRLFQDFNPEQNLRLLENLGRTKISQEQFCQIIGRLRLYQVLPASQLRELPKVILGDSNVNAATKGYIENPNFGLRGRENISCWDLMQLLNDAAKQSYIDKFLERNQNCTDFAVGIQKALNGEDTENYGWFLS